MENKTKNKTKTKLILIRRQQWEFVNGKRYSIYELTDSHKQSCTLLKTILGTANNCVRANPSIKAIYHSVSTFTHVSYVQNSQERARLLSYVYVCACACVCVDLRFVCMNCECIKSVPRTVVFV